MDKAIDVVTFDFKGTHVNCAFCDSTNFQINFAYLSDQSLQCEYLNGVRLYIWN